MLYLALASLFFGWLLVIGSMMLTQFAGFDSWKMIFTITTTLIGMALCLFTTILGGVQAARDEEQRNVYATAAGLGLLPLLYFVVRYAMFTGGGPFEFLLYWLNAK